MNNRKMSSNLSGNSDENLIVKFPGSGIFFIYLLALKYMPDDSEKSILFSQFRKEKNYKEEKT